MKTVRNTPFLKVGGFQVMLSLTSWSESTLDDCISRSVIGNGAVCVCVCVCVDNYRV